MMTKPICLIQSPVATRSGYGEQSRALIKHIIDLDLYDVKLISMPWGSTPINALDADNEEHIKILSRIIDPRNGLPRKPELFIQISIPNEFKPLGVFNIGFTAGIETNMCSPAWLEGCNRMDLILTVSEHSKKVFTDTKVQVKNSTTQEIVRTLELTTPIEVLPNSVDTAIFKKLSPNAIEESVSELFEHIPETFNYLFVGHWLKGNIGEDRKNVGLMVKIFCETFKNDTNAPGLILKTGGADFSILDRENILTKIDEIKQSVDGTCPNIYLIHGDLTASEMASLYNHPKVKVHVSFTKGEGFGLPLLEASLSRKPVIASGWSGQLDFLNPEDALLLAGELKPIDESAVWDNILIRESQWFNVDPQFAANALRYVKKNYENYLTKATRLAKVNRKKFSYDTVRELTAEILRKHVPEFEIAPEPEFENMVMPTLKRLT